MAVSKVEMKLSRNIRVKIAKSLIFIGLIQIASDLKAQTIDTDNLINTVNKISNVVRPNWEDDLDRKPAIAAFKRQSTFPIEYRPVWLDDFVPEMSFNILDLNGNDYKLMLSDFQGKLVILDFWATWCGTCIDKLPKLDSLQRKFKNRVQIILVNSVGAGDNRKKIRDFFLKRKKIKGQDLELINAIADSVAISLFPHQSLPHYAWIGSDRRVKAISSFEDVTEANIEIALKNELPKIPVKKDYIPDQLLDIPIDKVITDYDFPAYKLFRRGKIESLQDGIFARLQTTEKTPSSYTFKHRGSTFINQPLISIYKAIITQNALLSEKITNKLFLVDGNDLTDLVFDSSKLNHDEWEKRNLYTYDLLVPIDEIDSLYSYMISDLNHYSGYYGRIEKRVIKCLALVRNDKIDHLKTKGEEPEFKLYKDEKKKYIQNIPIKRLIRWLDGLDNFKIPVIDETDIKYNVDLDLTVDFNDSNSLINALRSNGLNLIEVRKRKEVFVLSKKK